MRNQDSKAPTRETMSPRAMNFARHSCPGPAPAADDDVHELPDIAALVRDNGAMTWSGFLLVPTGRGVDLGSLDDHARGEDGVDGVALLLPDDRLGCWDELA